jgi:alpha-D-ribose 1-methylphosphonate 5-triphosphate diphosphatase
MSSRDYRQSAGAMRIASEAIVLAERVVAGTIVIEAGLIVGLDEGRVDSRAEFWGKDLLIPGLIELHTDHLEPHYSPRPGVFWDPLSAVLSYDAQIATSGITTVFDSLRAGNDGDRHTLAAGVFKLAEAIEAARRAGMLRVEHLTHLRCEICSEDVVAETERFLAVHKVHLISLMDHTPGVRQFRDESKLRDYYRGKSSKTEAELDTFIAARKVSYLQNHDRHRSALIALARAHGITLASHDDTTVAHVEQSLVDGARLAEFPTTLEAAAATRRAGIAVMMGAPNVMRGGSHSGNVAARDLAERGLLDALSSDYVPASLLQGALMLADVPAMGGVPGAIRLVTKAPADTVGLRDRGEIAVGKRADLVRVDASRGVPVIREVLCSGARVA